jgi:hypothetical protein
MEEWKKGGGRNGRKEEGGMEERRREEWKKGGGRNGRKEEGGKGGKTVF